MFSAFNTSPNFIHQFVLVKLSCNQKPNEPGLHCQTYSWTKVISLLRIQTTGALFTDSPGSINLSSGLNPKL